MADHIYASPSSSEGVLDTGNPVFDATVLITAAAVRADGEKIDETRFIKSVHEALAEVFEQEPGRTTPSRGGGRRLNPSSRMIFPHAKRTIV